MMCVCSLAFPCWNWEDQLGVFAESRKLRGGHQLSATLKAPALTPPPLQGSLEHFQGPSVRDLGQLALVPFLVVQSGANSPNF